MAFRVYIFFVLFVFTNNALGRADALLNKYVSLINGVHNYYGTSSVFLIVSSNDRGLQEYLFVHTLCRDFSKKGVLTLMINFENLDKRTDFYRRQIVRPLIVVMLKAVSDITEFITYTENMNKAYPIWLVIFTDEFSKSLCKYCNNPTGNIFDIRFDTEMLVVCCDNPMLEEWWAVHPSRTEMADFATWSKNDGLTIQAIKGLFARRHDVNGTELRVSIVTNSALVLDDGDKIGGFFGDLLQELSRVMNFKIIITFRETVFGSWNQESESWSGVIGQLDRQETDLGAAEFDMTNSRLGVVDFTLPLLLSKSRLYMREPDGLEVEWSAYFRAFTFDIWMAIIVLILTTPVLLTFIKVRRGSILWPCLIAEHYLHVWGIFCQQGLSEFPAQTSLKIAYLSMFGTALVASAAYSATLISFLTVSSINIPFSTMADFANDGSYRLIVYRNSADYDYFATSTDPVGTKMMTLMKPWNDLPLSLEEAFNQVCKERVAFFSNEAVKMTIDIYLKCKIMSIESGHTNSLAMTLPAGSQYTNVLNYHLHRFEDNGMLHRLKQRYFIGGNPAETSHYSVSLWGVAPILSVLCGGIILAFAICLFEKICNTLMNNAQGSEKLTNSQKLKMHRGDKLSQYGTSITTKMTTRINISHVTDDRGEA